MGKTGDLFNKIRLTNGTFHSKMGTIKNRNNRNLNEAENIKKMMLKCCNSIRQQIWKTQLWPQDWKRSIFNQIPRKTMPMFFVQNVLECLNYCTIAFISHFSKVMLKILQARLQQYMNHELPDVQAGFRNGRGTRQRF